MRIPGRLLRASLKVTIQYKHNVGRGDVVDGYNILVDKTRIIVITLPK
jgi:hypothetical protein